MKRHEKPIRYQQHCLRRMASRGISEAQVSLAIRKPDRVGEAKRPRATRFEKAISKTRRLKVIAQEDKSEIWAISAMWM